MKFILLFLTLFSVPLVAQENLKAMRGDGNIYYLDWYGVPGRTYFIQVSSSQMAEWNYLPDIRLGQGGQLSMGFGHTSSEKLFFRLVHVDILTTNPEVADFDNDGFTNLEEVMYGMDPFVFDPGGNDDGGGTGNGTPPVPSAFELRVQTITEDSVETVTQRLDAGFNVIVGSDVGGVPSIVVSRSEAVRTIVTLTDLTGNSRGATLNYLVVKDNQSPHDDQDLPARRTMVGGVTFQIPDTGLQPSDVGPPAPPIAQISFRGTIPKEKANSRSIRTLQPMDISMNFGVGPYPNTLSNESLTGLIGSLNSLGINNQGDGSVVKSHDKLWGMRGLRDKDLPLNDDNVRFFGIEIAETEDAFLRSLQSKGRVVTFHGHSNFGMGPNFSYSMIKQASDFTNIGLGYTDIPVSFRGSAGNMPIDGHAQDRHDCEGWAYLEVHPSKVVVAPTNAYPYSLDWLRFRGSGAGDGQVIPIKGTVPNRWHYIHEGSRRVIVPAPKTQLPENLRYSSFWYDSCFTGEDYIDNFKHGSFIHTIRTCFTTQLEIDFIEYLLADLEYQTIVDNLNQRYKAVLFDPNDPNKVIENIYGLLTTP